MITKNNYVNSKTLEQELKHDKTVEREMGDTEDSLFIMEFMEKVERMRKERQKDSNGYTQKKLAERRVSVFLLIESICPASATISN